MHQPETIQPCGSAAASKNISAEEKAKKLEQLKRIIVLDKNAFDRTFTSDLPRSLLNFYDMPCSQTPVVLLIAAHSRVK